MDLLEFLRERCHIQGYIFDRLAVTRAFGNTSASKIGVITEPSVEKLELPTNAKFVILGSDGLWDGITMQKVGELSLKYEDGQEFANVLLQEGLEGLNTLQLDDNVSVIVIPIKNGLIVE